MLKDQCSLLPKLQSSLVALQWSCYCVSSRNVTYLFSSPSGIYHCRSFTPGIEGVVRHPLTGALANEISKRAESGKGTTSVFFPMPGGFTIVASYILTINTTRGQSTTRRKTKTGDTESASSRATELNQSPSTAYLRNASITESEAQVEEAASTRYPEE